VRAGSFGRFVVPVAVLAAEGPIPSPDYTRQMHPSAADFPNIVEVVVEIPRGSRNKYEWDEKAEVFRLDRVLASAVHYNFDYGFISGTRSGDGDHTDALLLIDEPTFPGCRVWARPIGGLEMRDEKGEDFKVLCVAVADPHQMHVEDLDQVRPHRLLEIENFFQTYKLLEAKETDVVGWRDASTARDVLVADRATWNAEPAGGVTSGAAAGR
jgi:inorganic pyrophosphatase